MKIISIKKKIYSMAVGHCNMLDWPPESPDSWYHLS